MWPENGQDGMQDRGGSLSVIAKLVSSLGALGEAVVSASATPLNARNHLFELILLVSLIDTFILGESAEYRQRVDAELNVRYFNVLV